MDSERWRLEDRLVAEVEAAQAELDRALRENDPSETRRHEAANKLEKAVERLCGLILRDIVPDESQD